MKNPENANLIATFYQAFKDGDIDKMVELYDPNVHFEDPAFGKLQGAQVPAMWHMLHQRAKGKLEIEYSNIQVLDNGAKAHWEAIYIFSATRRKVHNKINATFEIRDGRITRHIDQFDFWRWASQALGITGKLLGWTPFLRNKIQKTTRGMLMKYIEKMHNT